MDIDSARYNGQSVSSVTFDEVDDGAEFDGGRAPVRQLRERAGLSFLEANLFRHLR